MEKINNITFFLALLFFTFSAALFDESILQIIADHVKWFFLFFFMVFAFCFNKFCFYKVDIIGVFFVLIFMVVVGFSTVFSKNLNFSGLANLLGFYFLILSALFVFFPFSYHVNSMILFNGFYFSCLLCLFISFYIYLSGSEREVIRTSGVFLNPNSLGSISTIAFVCSVIKFIKYRRFLHVALMLMSLFFVVLSQSRNAYLACFVFVVVFLFLFKLYRLFFVLFVVFLTVYLGFIFFSYDFIIRDFDFAVDSGRQEIFKRHMNLFFEQPILGQGLSSGSEGGRFAAELAYTDILSFSGLLGFVSLILFFLLGLFRSIKFFSIENYYELGNLSIFIIVLLMSFWDGYISNIGNPLPIFAWLYLGLVFRLK